MRIRCIILLLLFTAFSCSSKKNLTIKDIISSQITSAGIGEIKLGNSFSEIMEKIPGQILYTSGSEGIFWDVYKINLENGEWVIIETDNGNFLWEPDQAKNFNKTNPNYNHYSKSSDSDKIKVVRTNSKRITTPMNIKIGESIKDAKEKGEVIDLFADLGGVNFSLAKEAIVFRIDEKGEKVYYEKGGDFPGCLDENSIINELKVTIK